MKNGLDVKKIFTKISILLCFVFFLTGCTTTDTLVITPLENEPEPVTELASDLEPMQTVTSTFFLPILALHHVGQAPSSLSADAAVWYISTSTLETILVEAGEHGYTTLTMSEVQVYLDRGELPQKPLVLTFDDGWSDVGENAIPLLREYRAKASVFIMTGVSRGVITDEELRAFAAEGLIDIQSHTRYHQYLTRVPAAEQQAELESSYDAIIEISGSAPVAIAYPFGLYDDAVIERAETIGYHMGLTIKAGALQEDLMELKRKIVTDDTDIAAMFDAWEY